MKKVLFGLAGSLLLSVTFSHCALADDSEAKANILVDDDKAQCPSAQYSTIQSAVNAANSGDVIRVCAGIYPEQVTIDKAITLRADNGAIVIPSNMIQNATSISSGDSIAAVFAAQGAQDIVISGFIIDGSNNALTECSPRLVGVFFQNASGHIRHNAIRHLNSSAINGCQSGNGVEVESASGTGSDVTVADNSVWDYQKNGITGNDSGTQIAVEGNAVSGVGPTTGAAQNGIQIGFGATGRIVNNSVSGNVWSPCVSFDVCETNATGILIFESNGVFVSNNSLATNQIAIFNGGDHSTIVSNTITNSITLFGVALVGDSNSVALNTFAHADDAAIYVQGNHNKVVGNEITDAAVGVLKISGSLNTTIALNRFFATLIPVQDPALTRPGGVKPVH
jgi:copper-binding protein NosD